MSFVTDIRRHARRGDVILVAVVLVLLVAGAIVLAMTRGQVKVHVLNGLDVPVRASLGGRTVVVPAHGREVVRVGAGMHVARASTDAGEIDSVQLYADPPADVVAYNVLGAAPLVLAAITYTARHSPNVQPNITVLSGKRAVVLPDVDYVFKEPPKTISTKSSVNVHKKALFAPEGGWTSAVGYALAQGDAKEAAEMMRTLVGVEASSEAKALSYAYEAAEAAWGPGAGAALVAPLLRHPELGDDAARGVLFDACRHQGCARGVDLLSRAAPSDSVSRKLLVLRTLPEQEARATLAALAAAHPEDPMVIRARAWQAYVDLDFKACAELYGQGKEGKDAPFDVEERALCRYAAGDEQGALDDAEAVATSGGDAAWAGALTWGRITRAWNGGRRNAGNPMNFLRKRRGGGEALASAELVDEVMLASIEETARAPSDETDPGRNIVRLALAALNGPTAAVASFAGAGATLKRMPEPLVLAIGAEAARLGQLQAARDVIASARRFPLQPEEVFDYVLSGKIPAQLYRLDPEQRAALDLVRARRLESLGQDSHPVYAEARRRDVLKGWVARLMEAWAPPEKRDDVVVFTAR